MKDFNFSTTHIGSLPHLKAEHLSRRIAENLDIPAWPQLPRRNFRESMYVQYSPPLPGLVLDEAREKVYFNTDQDLTGALERFYSAYLEDDLETFRFYDGYAHGFYDMLAVLERTPGQWAKGQVTGPISFGLTVTDQDLRPSLYNDQLQDAIVKNLAMNARWQIRRLKMVRSNVIIFLDEPYLASFGSAFVSLSRAQVTEMLDEVFDAIHAEGALAGVHCCANTDWSVLLQTRVDILNLDAHGYLENLALYPAEIRSFLDRDGSIAWGIVPSDENAHELTPKQIASQLAQGFELIRQKAAGRGVRIEAEELSRRSLITPSCGLGSTSVETADRVLELLSQLKQTLPA